MPTTHPSVFVLDKHHVPLQPCPPARARKLLAKKRAVVHRHTPFTIRLTDRTRADSEVDGVELGIDPGSQHTGIAVFTAQAGERRGRYSLQPDHRGAQISKKIGQRSAYRRRRRGANLRYRTPRFANRTRPTGWLARVLARSQAPLRDAAAAQSTRWALWRALDQRLPTRVGSGGRTKFNRTRNRLPKSHTLDALAVGKVETITHTVDTVLVAGCAGRGSYVRTRTDKHGFPRLRLPRVKRFFSFATGDLVRAVVPKGKKKGTHTGRVAVRATGRFNITTTQGTVQGINHRHMRLLQRADGYAYTTRKEQGVSSRP
ncbi:RRXRR domain-containing protein [Nocardiopsis oceani]